MSSIEEMSSEETNQTKDSGRSAVGRNMPLSRWFILGALVALAAGALFYWRYASARESTDDAEIDGHIHPISARVGGTVTGLFVKDNQYVEAESVLLQIDPRDYRVAMDHAEADVADAEAKARADRTDVPITSRTSTNQLSSATAGVSEAQADVAAAATRVDAAQAQLRAATAAARAAKANANRAERDLDRMKVLITKEEISEQQYDAALASADALRAQFDATQAQVAEAGQQVRVAQSELDQSRAKLAKAEADARAANTAPQRIAGSRDRAESSSAKVFEMKASLEQSELNFQYTTVRAPISGIISQRSVEVGEVVQAGQPLLSVVPLEDIWVTANFKENQLAHMHPGQPVTISVDAYGRTYQGHVDSIAAATGARFSLLPPENATGNYVKVVQRVPVKIVFEKGQDPRHLLRPGMSVVPTVITK